MKAPATAAARRHDLFKTSATRSRGLLPAMLGVLAVALLSGCVTVSDKWELGPATGFTAAPENIKILVYLPSDGKSELQTLLNKLGQEKGYHFRYAENVSEQQNKTKENRRFLKKESNEDNAFQKMYPDIDYILRFTKNTTKQGDLDIYLILLSLFTATLIPGPEKSTYILDYHLNDAVDENRETVVSGKLDYQFSQVVWLFMEWKTRSIERFEHDLGLALTKHYNTHQRYLAMRQDRKDAELLAERRKQRGGRYPQPTGPVKLTAAAMFTDDGRDNVLDALERGKVRVTVANHGEGSAYGVGTVVAGNLPASVKIEQSRIIEEIKPGQEATFLIQLTADKHLQAGGLRFQLRINDVNGFDANPIDISIPTAALRAPDLRLADHIVKDADGNGMISPEENVEIVVRIRNEGTGPAQAVAVAVSAGEGTYIRQDSSSSFNLGDLNPGEYRDIAFKIYTVSRASSAIVHISGRETRTDARLEQALNLPFMAQTKQHMDLVVEGKQRDAAPVLGSAPSLASPVDQPPATGMSNRHAVAVVIGNKDYANFGAVDYAINDAQVVRNYLVNSLGYDRANVIFRTNATLSNFREIFGTPELPGLVANYLKEGESDVFIYYSGHGAPLQSGGRTKAFFIPVDASANVLEHTAYSLDDFYSVLNKLKARSVFVAIDACFSGASGSGEMLIKNASPIFIEASPTATGKVTVLTSSRGGEISSWYREESHGLFTYLFLKGLRGTADTNGDGVVTTGEMAGFLQDNNNGLPYLARRLYNGRIQNPTFKGDPNLVLIRSN